MFIELTFIDAYDINDKKNLVTYNEYIKKDSIYKITESEEIPGTSIVYIANGGWTDYFRFKESPEEIIQIIMETEYNYSKRKLIKRRKQSEKSILRWNM